jgi:hypothetical protein
VADEDDKPPEYMRHIRPDVPTSGAIVRSQNEARTLALKMAGKTPPNECRFNCPMCGWDKTLQFGQEEIEALGGDITSYAGPCPGCDNMTLVPHAHLLGEEFTPAYQRAQENMRKQYEEQADVFIDKATEAVAEMMGGGVLASAPTDPAPASEEPDLSDLRPRKSEG